MDEPNATEDGGQCTRPRAAPPVIRPTPEDVRFRLVSEVLAWRNMGASPGAWLLQEFVLRAGRDWPGSPLPPRRRRMVPKRCFSNAARVVAASRGGLDYCEGFVMSRNVGLAVHHAWAVDRQTGAVVDPTLAEPGRAAYVGVAIGPSERATWLVEGSSSVLAGPIALNLDYLLFREPSLADLPEIAAVRS